MCLFENFLYFNVIIIIALILLLRHIIILLSIMPSRSILVVAVVGFSSFSWLNNIPVVCVCLKHIFIHSSVDRHFSYFHILAILNNVTINMRVQIPFWYPVFISFRYIDRSGMAGSYDSSNFNFWGNSMLFIKLLEEKVRKKFLDIDLDNNFLDVTPKNKQWKQKSVSRTTSN